MYLVPNTFQVAPLAEDHGVCKCLYQDFLYQSLGEIPRWDLGNLTTLKCLLGTISSALPSCTCTCTCTCAQTLEDAVCTVVLHKEILAPNLASLQVFLYLVWVQYTSASKGSSSPHLKEATCILMSLHEPHGFFKYTHEKQIAFSIKNNQSNLNF